MAHSQTGHFARNMRRTTHALATRRLVGVDRQKICQQTYKVARALEHALEGLDPNGEREVGLEAGSCEQS